LPGNRGGGGAAVWDNVLYFHGGLNDNTDYKDFGSLDLNDNNSATRTWKVLPQHTGDGRNHLGVAALYGYIYAIGGQQLEKEDCTVLVSEQKVTLDKDANGYLYNSWPESSMIQYRVCPFFSYNCHHK
jgi:hypothetical protein